MKNINGASPNIHLKLLVTNDSFMYWTTGQFVSESRQESSLRIRLKYKESRNVSSIKGINLLKIFLFMKNKEN